MRFGIPGYRTPREKLDAEIDRIVAMGDIEVRLGVKVGRDVSIEELERDYDAIFWGIGAQSGRPLPVPGADAENCLTGVEFLDAFNRGWVFSTAMRIVVVGGGDTSIDVASVARRLGHISSRHEHDSATGEAYGYVAHDVAGSLRREGVKAVLTSLFPVEQMTAAEREREDAKREGIEIAGGVMPLEVIRNEHGVATALRVCQCKMKGMTPLPIDGTEYDIECDMIISAIGQMADLAEGLTRLDSGRSSIAVDPVYQVKKNPKHFAGGDVIRPHLLTTAIGHGRVAAESIDPFARVAASRSAARRSTFTSSICWRSYRTASSGRRLTTICRRPAQTLKNMRSTITKIAAPPRSFRTPLCSRAIFAMSRARREERHVTAERVMGDFEERIVGFSEAQAKKEGERCMSCGLCFECDNCVIYCPQTAVQRVPKKERAVGRYVYTDYKKCIGCHICMDVCPTGYIQMGLGE